MFVTTKSKVLKRVETPHYPIYIGEKLYANIEHFDLVKGQNIFIITNQEIAKFYLPSLLAALSACDVCVDHFILPVGEQQKSVSGWQQIIDILLARSYTRYTTLIALGGGVINDLTGFVAATFQRGIRYISLPTTLLAQVDASVGGKTAINHPMGKNLIGAFYNPSAVIIDIHSLDTLSDREFSSGMAEIIKYGVILDKDFFQWLEQHITLLMERDKNTLLLCIERCCQLKSDVVAKDEHEHNLRALLNFGHTFGHAIEVLCGFGQWLHGECIAVGMLMAAELSVQLGLTTHADKQRIQTLLQQANLPTKRPTGIEARSYLPIMKRDKKRVTSAIRCVLNCEPGKGKIIDISDLSMLIMAIERV